MKVFQLQEQLLDNTQLQQTESETIIPFMEDGSEVVFDVKRGREDYELCLKLSRKDDKIFVTDSYSGGPRFKPWLVHTENQALTSFSQVLFSCLRKQCVNKRLESAILHHG